ncbi:uncharacterized protein PITG_06744 [Phytophthora infestans T30-4]|uniref:Uncharacterized protein n=1 Tax=Phytophthora infestans (strain T30-4) TaxID=403677 RepID=D0N803_PHYIT|nr:uncharacterized protein PITG_06744 [Phytophthora infestans T30-4]EEY53120.1 conserved hypothetical protein [Phytophthora infestans T30-4]|eukprot:XP_002904738.1 conserved hypothetical protein [Phytophthora infestans T30-4]
MGASQAAEFVPSELSPEPVDVVDLLKSLDGKSADEKEILLLMLLQACVNDEKRQMLYDANGIKVLVDLVRNGRTYFTQLYALECLHWAASSDAKVAPSDVSALRDCVKDVPSQHHLSAADALQNSSDDGDEKAALRCACIAAKGNNDDFRDAEAVESGQETQKLWFGLVPSLATLLQNGNDTQKMWTAKAMGNLALNNEDIRSEIARKDAIRYLVALVQVGTPEQKHRAAYALGNLALSKEAHNMIMRKGAITPLLTLMRTGSPQQKNGAGCALGTITRSSYTNLSAIAHETSVASLVSILLVGTDEQKESAVNVLADFVKNEKQCAEIASQGAISPLVALLQTGTTGQKQRAAAVLAGLAKRKEHCEEIEREGSLAWHNDPNCLDIAGAGGIVPLVALLARGTG